MCRSNCCFLTCIQISQEAGKVVCYFHPLKNFPVCCDLHSERLWHSQLSGSRCFSGILLPFWWFSWCWQFDLWFLCLFKSSLNIWKFTVHVLLKPGLENFEHDFASVWDESNCAVVWTLFSIAFLWDSFIAFLQEAEGCPEIELDEVKTCSLSNGKLDTEMKNTLLFSPCNHYYFTVPSRFCVYILIQLESWLCRLF